MFCFYLLLISMWDTFRSSLVALSLSFIVVESYGLMSRGINHPVFEGVPTY